MTLPNDTALPPFTPDKTPTQSGFQSKSLDNDAEAPGGHQFIFEDDAKKPFVKLHSQRDLHLHAANDFTQHVEGKSSTTVLHGNYVHHANGRLTIKADKAVHLVSGQSRISVTDSDIIIEADQIAIGAGGSAGASPDAIKNAMAAANAAADQAVHKSPVNSANTTKPTSATNTTNTTPKKTNALEEAFPAVSLDLNLIKPIEGVIAFEGKPFTYNAQLSGNITLQKQGTHPVGEFSPDGYKVEARNTLGNFFSSVTLHPTSHEQFMLGSQVTGEFVTTTFIPQSNNKFRFLASPSPIDKTYKGWDIEGNLSFSIDLQGQDNPPSALPTSQHSAWFEKEWHNIEASSLIAAAIAIGVKLEPIIEDIVISAFVIA